MDGASARSPRIDSDPINVSVDPVFWTVTVSPAQSVDYLFAETVDYGESSAVLWFVSDDGPVLSEGALFGTSSGVPVFATGDLLTPESLPEPATIILLGMGWLMTVIRKRPHV